MSCNTNEADTTFQEPMAENVLEPMTDIMAKIKAEQILSKIKRNPNSQSENQTKQNKTIATRQIQTAFKWATAKISS